MFNRDGTLKIPGEVSAFDYLLMLIGALLFNLIVLMGIANAQVDNPGVQAATPFVVGDCVKAGPGLGQVQTVGTPCPTGTFPVGANPTATAGPTAVNGSAPAFMRSDAAPAVQKGTNSQFGLVQGDGSTISCAATPGICSALIDGIFPSATVAGTLVYWNATAWVVLPGNTTGTQVLSENASGVPSWSAAGSGTLQTLTAGTGISFSSGATCTTTCIINGVAAANPSATAGPTAVNGSASTFMRSDAAPAVRGGNNTQVGLVGCDGTGVTCPASTISVISATKAQQQTGTVTNVPVTPSIQQQHDSAIKAWGIFTASTGTALASYNSSTARTGTGVYTVTFSTAFASTSYACEFGLESAGGSAGFFALQGSGSRTANGFTIDVFNFSGNPADPVTVSYNCQGRQ